MTAEQSTPMMIGHVTAESGLNLRQGPSTDASTIATIPNNAELEVIGREGEWLHVRYQGREGYCSDRFVTLEDESGRDSSPPVLTQGQRGERVADAQRQLVAAGYKLTVDGIFGTAMSDAVTDFQKRHGIAADGVIGPATLGALATAAQSSQGDTPRDEISRSAYLLTWNPKRFRAEEIEPYAKELATASSAEMGWSTGIRKDVEIGARVYLVRLAVEPKGLVGVGRVVRGVEELPHWDPVEREKGRTYNQAGIRWSKLAIEPIKSIEALAGLTGDETFWLPQSGGKSITPEIADAIDELLEEPAPTDVFRYAQTLSDLDHSMDWIGIRSDVEALSTLVSVDRVEPPLSIAIFGDWGSGKTFLMRKMQERVQVLEEIAQSQKVGESGQDGSDATTARYCSSILQIEFNAWHYTESNLWASLVNEIFEKLHARLDREQGAGGAGSEGNVVEQFFTEFTTAQEAKRELEAQEQRMKAEVDIARKNAAQATRDLRRARNSLAEAVGRNVWSRVQSIVEKGGEAGFQAKEVQDALKYFGFSNSAEELQTIQETVVRFRSSSGRAREILGSLLSSPGGVKGAFVFAALTLIVSIVAYRFGSAIVGIGPILAGAIALVARHAKNARPYLDDIEKFDGWLTGVIQDEESERSKKIAAGEATLEARQEALVAVQEKLREAEARHANAAASLEGLTARDRMRRFVNDRVTAESYAKHLGLVSMIRRDFGFLSRVMDRDRQAPEAALVRRIESATGSAIPTVERIILYIDDLDRCQPERVVEVLEAIHLLLSFPLFVVVVAVDPRWVLQSLKLRYPYLAEDVVENGKDGHGADAWNGASHKRAAATAHDYLEKIFNIPFWVRPMSPNASTKLIEGYLGIPPADGDDGATREKDRFDEILPARTARGANVTELKVASPDSSEDAGGRSDDGSSDAAGTLAERVRRERMIAQRRIQSVEIGEAEQTITRGLAPYLGNSPRRIKRFANTYRLFKSGLSDADLRRFTPESGDAADARIVLVLLSIVTGAPNLAPGIFARIYEGRSKFDPSSIETQIHKLDAADPFEVADAIGALKTLGKHNVTAKQIEVWMPVVMRFAFRLVPVVPATEAAE